MKKITLIILGLLQFSLTLKSQDKIRLYFNSNWEVTSKDKAVYIRDAEYDFQSFTLNGKVTDRDLKGILVMEGNYLYGKRNGEFFFYNRNGNIENKGEYLNNKMVGNWSYYYPNGRLKQTAIYFDNPKKGDFGIVEYYDRYGNPLIKNGTGEWHNDSIQLKKSDNSSLFSVTGQFKDSLKTGKWKLIRIPDRKIVQTERFSKGRLISDISPKYYGNFGNQSRMGQRIQEEFRTGILRNNLTGDASFNQLDEVSQEILEREGTVSLLPGLNAIPEGIGKRMMPDHGTGKNISAVTYSTILRNLNKIPDQNIGKLSKTEGLMIDSIDFPKLSQCSDIETFFKAISETEIRISNRKALYPYGENLLLKFIASNIRNTNYASLIKNSGKVFVKITIGSFGDTKDVKIIKGINEENDKEVVRVISLIKKWLPAMSQGNAIESSITIPVKFELARDDYFRANTN